MKAITISQPFASLIASGEKWCENRTWPTSYRGPLAIHAGKGTQYLDRDELRDYPTGCVVAVCHLIACVPVGSLQERIRAGMVYDGLTLGQMQRLLEHEHCEGPYAFVLDKIQKLDEPIPAKGAQGFWEWVQ